MQHEYAAGAILYTIDNGVVKFILVEESDGHIGFPKGHIENGETDEVCALREIWEETGIHARPEEFEFLESGSDHCTHYDYYCLKKKVPLEEVVLQPEETDDVCWVTYEEIHTMIQRGQICKVIANQFLRQEPMLKARTGQTAQNG